MKKKPSLNAQAKALFIGSVLGMMFQFFIPVLLVRVISNEDFGVFRQFQFVASTFLGFTAMGFGTSLYYFYPVLDDTGKQKIIQQTQLLYAVSTIILLIILYFFGKEILTYFNFTEFINLALYLVAYILFTRLSTIIDVIFTLEKNTFLNKVFPSVDKLMRFLIFLLTVLIIPGIKGPIMALVIYSIVRFVYCTYHISPYLKKIYKIDLVLLKKQLIYTVPLGLAIVLNQISTKFDKILVNQHITPEEFGIYSIAFLGIPILGNFFQSIHNVVVPQISIYINDDKLNEATKLWKKMVDKTSSVTIPAVFIFLLLADEIITILYTKDFIEAANYYRIFILSFLVSMFSYNIILRGANKTKYILIIDAVSTLLTVLFGIIIIPIYGLYGAILTALLGNILPMIFSLHIERKIMKQSFRNWVNWKEIGINFFINIVVILILFLLKDYITNIYLRFVITGLLFVVSIIFLQIKFKIFMFNKTLASIRNRIGYF